MNTKYIHDIKMDNSNYSEVYSWFEKSGIISNIRTHLRQNLVNALKSKTNPCKVKTDVRSAKQYVYDMLIAEYLLNYNYAYTLSVFASEAPLLINLNGQHADTSPENQAHNTKNKLPNDYVFHTLETLGINPKNSDGKNILLEYSNSEAPLILCVIKYFTSQFVNDKSSNESLQNDKMNFRNQGTQTDTNYSQDFIAITEAKEKLYQQKQIFASQLKNKELELKEQAIAIEKQLVSLNEKLHHAQNLMRLVDTKEHNLAHEKIENDQILANKEKELLMREKLVTQESDRLQKERDSYRTFEGDMRKLKEELSRLRNELPAMTPNLVTLTRDDATQTDICGSAEAEREVRLLNEEKRELSGLIKEQHSRIEELTLRAISLARQLEEAQLLIPPSINATSNATGTKHVNFHINTPFSESSSTEDLLQDAKMRLRRLEEESLRADQYFYNCITTSP